jgi:hypothetical protein
MLPACFGFDHFHCRTSIHSLRCVCFDASIPIHSETSISYLSLDSNWSKCLPWFSGTVKIIKRFEEVQPKVEIPERGLHAIVMVITASRISTYLARRGFGTGALSPLTILNYPRSEGG